jgi:DNA-binding CsgD family transcriptional regulator/pimeloyl-ACP methyl ester carboxylesterase
MNIAYAVCGEGAPLIFPPVSYSHVQLNWEHRYFVPSRRLILEALAKRFQLIQFDHRGQGMSSRGLTTFEMTDFVLDLEAVVERVNPGPLIIYAGGGNAHQSIMFTVRHPESVKALIISASSPALGDLSPSFFRDFAIDNWDFFLESQLARGLTHDEVRRGVELIKQTTSREDYIIEAEVWSRSDVSGLLSEIHVPTLVLHPRLMTMFPVEQSKRLSAQIPGARMELIEGESIYGDSESAMHAIERFLSRQTLHDYEASAAHSVVASGAHRLSRRETEVLRLIAAGRSNQQIADELVLSLRTVERHITNLYGKIGAHGKAEATAYALRHGLE